MYYERQVSRLITSACYNQLKKLFHAAFRHPSQAMPSGLLAKLMKYGDEIAQDLHLLPFSPAQ
jgi:hypothetical protein